MITILLPSIYIAFAKFHTDDIYSEVISSWFNGKEVLSPFWEKICFIWAAGIKPFGIPYLSPVLPFRAWEFKGVLWRGNLKKIINSRHSFRE
ncbi:hypothetical protein ACFQPF_14840 [Fictibacillus iocasae]|uniref:Uncharacterized protein n=1 Tax=Fictibacillus iocasae TaxID=2715437 RepID=A0ABW2NWD6_9BACL